MCGCFSHGPHWGLARNLGMCPDWELNRQQFGSQPTLNPLSYTSQGGMMALDSDDVFLSVRRIKIYLLLRNYGNRW